MDDGGNVDDPVGHCDPAHGRCGCYHEVPFADSWIDAQTLGRGHMLGDDDFFTVRLPFPFELPPWWPDTPRFRQATANERRPPVSWPSLGGARDGGEWSDEEGERRPEGRDWVPGQETP